jgi:hypothetical protein
LGGWESQNEEENERVVGNATVAPWLLILQLREGMGVVRDSLADLSIGCSYIYTIKTE